MIVVKRRSLNLARMFHSRPAIRIKPVLFAKGLWIRILNTVHTVADVLRRLTNRYRQKIVVNVIRLQVLVHQKHIAFRFEYYRNGYRSDFDFLALALFFFFRQQPKEE